MNKSFTTLLMSITLASMALTVQAKDLDDSVVHVTANADYADIRTDVESAILNQGFVIDLIANVGDMLNRTAADVGIDNPVYKHAETWQFCSAKLSHEMVLADPLNIAFCPYVIFAYETVQSPGEVTVGYRRPVSDGSGATSDALNIVEQRLLAILNDIGSEL